MVLRGMRLADRQVRLTTSPHAWTFGGPHRSFMEQIDSGVDIAVMVRATVFTRPESVGQREVVVDATADTNSILRSIYIL